MLKWEKLLHCQQIVLKKPHLYCFKILFKIKKCFNKELTHLQFHLQMGNPNFNEDLIKQCMQEVQDK